MSKHTPGPWVVDGNDISPADNDRLGICSVQPVDDVRGGWRYGEETFANAHLIAAAPDLLDALLMAEEMLARLEPIVDRGEDDSISVEAGLIFAKAAIAKAKGEQP